jgi:glycerol uptake facilitator-like aquaporin
VNGTLRSSLAEFMGTFAVVWLAAGAACADPSQGANAARLGTALAYGLALGMATYAFAAADAHFNPAVTAALFLTRRIDGVRAVFLVFSQLLGSALAGMFLVRSFHQGAAGAVCSLSGVGFRMGTLIEAMTAFWVAFAFCLARLERREAAGGAAAVGAAAICSSLATGALTGGAFNPARAFGPALATGQWANWYVYWAGPLVGAGAAALLYESLFAEKKQEAR